MTYQEALSYLDSFINYEKLDGYNYALSFELDRMKKLVRLLGDPQIGPGPIHIAGTKGKGSTSAIVHSILKNAGFIVGLYTSPHLVSFRERIRINDELISEGDIARLIVRIKDVVDRIEGEEFSFFELYTALAYLYFNEKKADLVVYEVGLGGRLDATNIIEPIVCAITPISYEHTDRLGNTLAQIAFEKAGIIKEGSICVSAPQEKEALEVIEKICSEKKTRLILVGRDIAFREIFADDKKEIFDITGSFGEYAGLEMGLLGSHQPVNAATAIGVVEALGIKGITVPERAIREGLKTVRWPGRLEVVGRRPFLVLDGAQNRASAAALAIAIKKLFRYRRLILVLGISKDKDIAGILDELTPISDSIILTKSKALERAIEPSKIVELIDGRKDDVALTFDVGEALRKARVSADQEDLILITGSLFVAGEAREILVDKAKNVSTYA